MEEFTRYMAAGEKLEKAKSRYLRLDQRRASDRLQKHKVMEDLTKARREFDDALRDLRKRLAIMELVLTAFLPTEEKSNV